MSSLDFKTLIACVKQHPELYDPQSQGFYNNKLKSEIWDEIGKECYVAGIEAKNQWLKIRECHREALRRKSAKIWPAKTKSWKYEKLMDFLLPYMRKKARRKFGCERWKGEDELSAVQPKVELEELEMDFEEAEESDPLRKFFEAMYLSVKALSPPLQTDVKKKIFEAVCEAETVTAMNASAETPPVCGSTSDSTPLNFHIKTEPCTDLTVNSKRNTSE